LGQIAGLRADMANLQANMATANFFGGVATLPHAAAVGSPSPPP